MKTQKKTSQVVSSTDIDSVELETDNDISKVAGVEICDELSDKPEKNTDKPKNLTKENINNSNNNFNMNKQPDNVFDKLYQDLMEADELPTMDDDMFASDEPTDDPEGFGGDETGEDVVTLELPKELADQLYEMLGGAGCGEPSGDEELEDLDSDDGSDPFGDEPSGNPFEDSIEVVAEPKPLADSAHKSGNNSSMNNKPSTSGYGKQDGKKANSGSIPEPKGDPSELKDSAMKSGNNSNMGSNKVNASGYSTGDYIK
jgi:hypothetical protein